MIAYSDVTACLVTRGDQPAMLERILDSLIFDRVIVWDNSHPDRADFKTAGRYAAMLEAETPAVYVQDDDVLVPPTTQRRLAQAFMPGVVIANYGHGENDGGYGDLPLVCGGAIMEPELPLEIIEAHYPEGWEDPEFLYYCDFAIGVLYRDFRHLYLPFEIELAIAQAPERLCNQPWAADMKRRVTERARAIREREGGTYIAETIYPAESA